MRTTVLILCLLAAMSAYGEPGTFSNGYAGAPPSNNTCRNCHSSYPLNGGDGDLYLTGLPTNGYQSGVTYNLTLHIEDVGMRRWGFQVTTIYQSGSQYLQAGNLMATDPTHTVLSQGSGTAPDYLKNNSAGNYNNVYDAVSYDFAWQAPDVSTGPLTFYYCGMACNYNGGTSGDYVYAYSTTVNPYSGGAPDIPITLTYLSGSPVPAGGGSLYFDVYMINNSGATQSFDAWLAVEYQGGAPTTVVQRALTGYQSGWAVNRPNMFFPVPGSWAGGNYDFFGRNGIHPSAVWNEDSFAFVKSGADAVGTFVPTVPDGVPNPFDEIEETGVISPSQLVLHEAYPNPFNPSTTISFNLPMSSWVRLTVFDLQGRQVAELLDGWRNAGHYESVFDASGLASAVYLYQLEAGTMKTLRKMVLAK